MKPEERHVEFLRNLERMTYAAAVYALTDQDTALKTAFECTLHGWVDKGTISEQGREVLREAWFQEGMERTKGDA